ncbi:DUF3108 domain-containing protein [Candidatus Wolfebacteria bacterium]|nr:DUF3108 domain-containing protein [Candidatus Wolfebacteria bacterium]
MNKKNILFTILCFVLVSKVNALEISSNTISSPYDLIRGTISLSKKEITVPWFGEELKYELKWGVISMGHAYIEVKEIVNFNGEPAYHIISKAESNRFADAFYKVRDTNESWVSVKDLRSLAYSKNLREGDFYRDEWTVFDYKNNKSLTKQVDEDGTFRYSTGTVAGPVQDILSSVYYIRPHKLEVDDEVEIDVSTGKTWPLKVKVLRKAILFISRKDPRSTIMVEPTLREEGLFIQKGKSMKIWLTRDKRHIPLRINVEIVFGSISGDLKEINGKKP